MNLKLALSCQIKLLISKMNENAGIHWQQHVSDQNSIFSIILLYLPIAVYMNSITM